MEWSDRKMAEIKKERINNEASVGREMNGGAKKKAGRKNPSIFPRGPFSNLQSYTFLQFPREPLMYFLAAFLLMFMAVVLSRGPISALEKY